jgi:hypothetical protein
LEQHKNSRSAFLLQDDAYYDRGVARHQYSCCFYSCIKPFSMSYSIL